MGLPWRAILDPSSAPLGVDPGSRRSQNGPPAWPHKIWMYGSLARAILAPLVLCVLCVDITTRILTKMNYFIHIKLYKHLDELGKSILYRISKEQKPNHMSDEYFLILYNCSQRRRKIGEIWGGGNRCTKHVKKCIN